MAVHGRIVSGVRPGSPWFTADEGKGQPPSARPRYNRKGFSRLSPGLAYSLTPRPIYRADGGKVFDIYGAPSTLCPEVEGALGAFPFPAFWGPRAGIASSRWIADSARWVEQRHRPGLNLVYFPHLDYNLQRLGPSHPAIAADLRQIDEVVGGLVSFFKARGVGSRCATNSARKFWTPGRARCSPSRTIRSRTSTSTIRPCCLPRALLEKQPGIERVLGKSEQTALGIDHARSGDLLAVADARSWFAYYY